MGRPRKFDIDEALDRALEVFWRHGYEGATIPDLTRAMGINRPSLYAAFGKKEALFRKALERYQNGPIAFVHLALAEPTARKVTERLLCGAVQLVTDTSKPRGCMVVQGALACGDDAEPIRRALTEYREAGFTAIRARFERALSEGDLPKGTDCTTLARYIATVLNGLAVQAASGASADELRRVAEFTMRAFPANE
ncbi:family transcriptional regulator : Transcriptional regulator, TetR family OS=Anaeromyxobacter sp. (strain Fw109-5) GN=Anae109_3254 PE=4 SV=1: TetR_N [Gemmata massiliana]|uniref:HTH tetR-type domain-containing protein n=1 Tax=Gemmata massiliana TaxID=1210884 RepID=A0A6P2D0Z5_9BACT|nr:TetR/AcrR family transcriptional regulator [Gemmata massiliana]VTR94507.1 family transcriptional regulator : Transcriptional regulator, TetR family OS=Anaeromyxobacter sp. (strain Fw109-5) GN=Anae109_3254 PE=4 SV=1: TetR_N [Gemmata massiliana]